MRGGRKSGDRRWVHLNRVSVFVCEAHLRALVLWRGRRIRGQHSPQFGGKTLGLRRHHCPTNSQRQLARGFHHRAAKPFDFGCSHAAGWPGHGKPCDRLSVHIENGCCNASHTCSLFFVVHGKTPQSDGCKIFLQRLGAGNRLIRKSL